MGGTDIKFGILNDKNELIHKESIPTIASDEQTLISQIANKCKELMQAYSINGIGVGTPGLIEKGRVTASNLPFKGTFLAKELERLTGISVRVANDANCAALGESTAGAGRNSRNIVMITIGTGIGGGIIINNKLYEGKGSAGEIGHIIVEKGGIQCPCGQRGCWERYSSASALVDMAKKRAEEHKDSVLYSLYKENGKMNGKIFFEAVNRNCPDAKTVLDEYIERLADGINSIANIFEPDMIILSGGITNAGDSLLTPLSKKVNVTVHIAQLKNDAGIIGAAMLQ
ncbi:MAG: ROK family protein [Clostridiales bacterium]|nr:ROK family protein [Clostridiales bacterium]